MLIYALNLLKDYNIYQFSLADQVLRHIRTCINEKMIQFISELMENIIVEEGGSIEG